MRQSGNDRHSARLRALIAVLSRGGLRIQEALALAEHDLDQTRGSLPDRSEPLGIRSRLWQDCGTSLGRTGRPRAGPLGGCPTKVVPRLYLVAPVV
jgi:integrase